jgi:hypothetical protein
MALRLATASAGGCDRSALPFEAVSARLVAIRDLIHIGIACLSRFKTPRSGRSGMPRRIEHHHESGEDTMTIPKMLLAATALAMFSAAALAQSTPAPWVLEKDMGYGYTKDGKLFSYKMGTNNAGDLLKGAKKVPRNTLFFVGANGQLYMRRGSFLDGDGQFLFGPS